MNKSEHIEAIFQAFKQNGIKDMLSDETAEKLYKLSSILTETNKTFNLTAITEPNEIILKHFVDCAVVTQYIPTGANIVDVGCGAGFPSLPIAILRSDVAVTGIDSTAKKVNFINETAASLSINNISAISARAEDFAKANRESFDVSVSRAVARMNVLDELCLPLTKQGGLFIAMKSNKGDEEYREAKSGIEKLGGSLEDCRTTKLSFNNQEIEREIFIIRKLRTTPRLYPRNYSQISKKPL